MKPFVDQFLELPHRKFFETLALQDLLAQVRLDLGTLDLSHQWISLSHSDSIYFCLAFLEIIDRGGAPIALPSAQNLAPNTWSFIEGKTHFTRPGAAQSPRAGYAVPTSGTTGQAKICEFSLSSALQLAAAHAQGFSLGSDYEIVQTLPTHHSYGIIAYILTPLVTKTPVNFCSGMVGLRKLKKDPEQKTCILHVSPSQARFIMRDKVTAENLKKISIGGGSISLNEVRDLQGLLPHAEVYVSYGLTEAGPRVSTGLFTTDFMQKHKLGGDDTWIGSPLRGIEVKLGEPREGDEGRLFIKTPHHKLNPLSDELEGDWLKTRDRVKLIGNEIFFLSREDDLIKFGGITIYPRDIEQLARGWPGVSDAIILKQNDLMYGDRPLLFLEGNLKSAEAQDFLTRDVPLATAFQKIYILNKFPRQSLEKVDRRKLMDHARSEEND